MDYVRFALNEEVEFNYNYRSIYIDFPRQYPLTSYRVSDYVEIDLDKTCRFRSYDVVDASAIRRVSSSAVVSSLSGSLAIPTTPSSAAEVARTVTQTVLD